MNVIAELARKLNYIPHRSAPNINFGQITEGLYQYLAKVMVKTELSPL